MWQIFGGDCTRVQVKLTEKKFPVSYEPSTATLGRARYQITLIHHLGGKPRPPGGGAKPGGPPGGPPKPGGANPAGGKPGGGNPGGPPRPANPGPPTPAAGPCSPMPAPLPAGLLIPVPVAIATGTPAAPGALVPSLALGSAGGGPSREQDTTLDPRTMAKPRARFSSVSTVCWAPPPGAPALVLRFTRRNSSVSASTRFMCCAVSVEALAVCSLCNRAHLVEGQHLAHELSSVLHGCAHLVVDLRRL
jgi:hypothetical protein